MTIWNPGQRCRDAAMPTRDAAMPTRGAAVDVGAVVDGWFGAAAGVGQRQSIAARPRQLVANFLNQIHAAASNHGDERKTIRAAA